MRTHGWAGSPPADDHEAIARILAATHRCVLRHGGHATISNIAGELGVSRQTVYRYFASTDALLEAAARDGVEDFLGGLAARLRPIDDPAQAVVEAISYTVERSPDEPYLGLLMGGSAHSLARSVTSPTAHEIGRNLLRQTAIDWAAFGLTDTEVDELVEWTLRTVQSFLLDPGEPERDAAALRGYLQRWLAPAVTAATARSSTPVAS